MIIERDVAPYVVYSAAPLLAALAKISANKSRIVFCVDAQGRLEGSLSDGDFRRWLTSSEGGEHRAESVEALAAARRDCRRASTRDTPAQIASRFASGISHIPILDDAGHLVGVAIDNREVLVGDYRVGPETPTLLIAEIGINHQGSVSLAKELVDHAVAAQADVVKFQLRDLDALYRQSSGQSAGEDLGPQYTLDLLNKFNLNADQLSEVFDYARAQGTRVMCTPWDLPSLARLVDYGVDALKVASADLTNHPLLTEMAASGIALVASTGMATEAEILETVELLRRQGASFALLHCQSTYPAPFKDLNLAYLPRLAEIGRCPVGYSGHERGIHVPVAAVAMGARIIEKHLTIDRALEGNDHKVSLLPEEFATLVRQVREVEEALGSAAPREVSTGEQMNRVNLAKSLVAARPIQPGQALTNEDIAVKSPGRGIQPNLLPKLVGRQAVRELAVGDFFYATDLAEHAPRGRQFVFRRPWGLAVRYHDVLTMTRDCTPDFLEFHFSYKDLEIDPVTALTEPLAQFGGQLPMGLTTHSPDLFAGDFLLNLAAADDAHWQRSIAELQRVVDLTRRLRDFFVSEQDPVLVASLGGFTYDAHVSANELPDMYARVADGLAKIDDHGVRLCAQTLPPFPWYLGGQLFCNLFVNAIDTAEFARTYQRALCLDVSHSKLAANFAGVDFATYVAALAPYAQHLHLVDAVGVDGEGVQVGDGEIDWPRLAGQLDEICPKASFIPEIWQGHVNDGEGFWVALARLEQWF